MDRLLIMLAQDYLVGDRPLDHLVQRIMDITWDNTVQVNADAMALAKELDLRIAEFTGGHIEEGVLKDLIREAADLKPFVLNAGDQALRSEAPVWQTNPETQTRKVVLG